MTPLSIVHVTTEYAPHVRVGGRADMVGGLAREQARRGHRVMVVMPRYDALDESEVALGERRALAEIEVPWGLGRERAGFEWIAPMEGQPGLLLVEHVGPRAFFRRPGVYDDPATGAPWSDNAERDLFLARASLEGLKALGQPVDVIHAHDHHAAWVPCFARLHEARERVFERMATVFTVHNLGYQGLVDSWVLAIAGLSLDQFFPGSVFEFWGRVNFMKVGLAFADRITTVSPRHAHEIRHDGEFGYGLEGLLQRRATHLTGILNGLDESWDPATDPWIAERYGPERLEARAVNRAALVAECELAGPDLPVVALAAGLEEQKGWDLIVQAERELLELEARFVFTGRGQPRFRDALEGLAAAHPQRVFFREGRDTAFTHRMIAGSDLWLQPSRFEPCGYHQMAAQRYGTAPLVRAVGGLADAVEAFDPLAGVGTGFRFDSFEPAELVAALRRGLALHRQGPLWRKLQANAMRRDFSWRGPAERYDEVYAAARAQVASEGPPTLDSVRERFELRGR